MKTINRSIPAALFLFTFLSTQASAAVAHVAPAAVPAGYVLLIVVGCLLFVGLIIALTLAARRRRVRVNNNPPPRRRRRRRGTKVIIVK